MVTPSGTNTLHGTAFWQNRDNALAANSFFNNKSGLPKPLYKQSQFGGSVGGPVMKSKVFFFAQYEGFRRQQAGAQNQTIAANPSLFRGEWRYVRTSDGSIGSINILNAVGATADPKLQTDLFSNIPDASKVNSYDRGDSRADRLLNTAGYRWNQNRVTERNYFVGRDDIDSSARHRFESVGTYFKEIDDCPDLDVVSGPGERPLAFTESPVKRFVGAWRWLASSRLQNELRYGANLAPVGFEVVEGVNPTIRFAGQNATLPLTLMNPQICFPQGRYTNTYQFTDNANLMWGDHALQMGAMAEGPREPVQLRSHRADDHVGVQFRRAGQRAAHLGDVPGRHQCGGPVECQHDAVHADRHDQRGVDHVPGEGTRRPGHVAGHPQRPQLHAGQHRGATSRTTGA